MSSGATPPRSTGLKELLDAANDAAKREATQWFFLVTLMVYLAVAVGSTTHRKLLLEEPIQLPIFNVALPLTGFYVVAPAIFVVLHFYVLAQIRVMAGKVRAAVAAAEAEAERTGEALAVILARVDNFPVAQMMVGRAVGRRSVAMTAMAWLTLIVAPVLLLLFFQVRFLPYQDPTVTWVHRGLLALDLGLLWWLWPWPTRPHKEGDGRTRPSLKAGSRVVATRFPAAVVTGLVGFFSLAIATVPEEWADGLGRRIPPRLPAYGDHGGRDPLLIFWDRITNRVRPPEPARPVVPAIERYRGPLREEQCAEARRCLDAEPWPLALRRALFDGAPDPVSQRPTSLFSRVLVLPNETLLTEKQFEALAKQAAAGAAAGDGMPEAVARTLVLRGRSLRGAVFTASDLRKADLTGAILVGARLDRAWLQGASLIEAQVQGASLKRAQMQGASLTFAQMQGASLDLAQMQGASLDEAQMQGASLDLAQMQGASLIHAQMQGASLHGAQMQGALLNFAQMQGASLDEAQMQSASLHFAQMQGASLDGAQMQGAWLERAHMQGASLNNAHMQGASLNGAHMQGASLNEAQMQSALLHGAQMQSASLHGAQMRGASLNGAQMQGASLILAQMQGASLIEAQMQGASLDRAQMQGAILDGSRLWRVAGAGADISLASLYGVSFDSSPPSAERNDPMTWQAWIDRWVSAVPDARRDAVRKSLAVLLAYADTKEQQETQHRFKDAAGTPTQPERVVEFLIDLACSEQGAPFVARRIVAQIGWEHSPRSRQLGRRRPDLARALLPPDATTPACPGARDLTAEEIARLRAIAERRP